jgi:hypothetical protein
MGRVIAPIKKEHRNDSAIEIHKQNEIDVNTLKHNDEGVKLLGNPVDLFDLLITDVKEKKWALDLLINESPKHKQILSTLLVNRLFKLVNTEEKNTGTENKDQYNTDVPKGSLAKTKVVSISSSIFDKPVKKKVSVTVSKEHENETIVYAMCIQVIEWAINATQKK